MDKLIEYLNGLGKESRADFASRCGTSEGYMRKARSAKQKFRSELCVRIERQSNGAVTRQDLRDDWAEVWPELIPEPSSNGDPQSASDDTQGEAGGSSDRNTKEMRAA
jgi:DNA-binding transcriptional regulator YdaS (Cro superfamily)